ncbi:MAG: helix-turn-helix domain-containing protein [Alphaproteobacteria bacterium]|nr:helix-turn-helix domain-containing protein [Alphaproteobacteria bacterium]
MVSPSQIRAARSLIGIKQSDLARGAGISLATLNNIERGIGDPRASTLEAIERALTGAGIEFAGDPVSECVKLRRLDRPTAYETLFASQRVLELLSRRALTPVQKVLLFARRPREGAGTAAGFARPPSWDDRRATTRAPEEEDPRICLLIEGHNRAVLFDQVQFSVANAGRAAEVAAILLWAFSFHKNELYYLEQVLDDTTAGDLPEVVARLRSLNWLPLRHPADFFNVFDDWDGRLKLMAEREGHPMRELAALFSGS